MSIYLYYNTKNSAYFITNLPLNNEVVSDNNILARTIYAEKNSKILPLYLFLLAKYCTRALNVYENVDAKLFLKKFDKITKRYMQINGDKVEYSKLDFERSAETSIDAVWISTFNDAGKIPVIELNMEDARFLLTETKKKLGAKTIFDALLFFWKGIISHSANSLLFGLIPVLATQNHVILFDVKFPIMVMDGKIYIYESFLHYFPLCIDSTKMPCSITGVRVDGFPAIMPIQRISSSTEIIDKPTFDQIKHYLDGHRALLSLDFIGILAFLDKK